MKKSLISGILTVALAGTFAFGALAAGPGEFSSMDDATYARLMDNKAEWDEIENLVIHYNPTYRLYADSVEQTNDELSAARDTFRDEMKDSMELIDENLETVKKQREDLSKLPGFIVIDQYGTTVSMALGQLSMAETTLNASRTQVKEGMIQGFKTVDKTVRTTKEALKPARQQLQKTIETLVISYQQLLVNRTLVEGQAALYETMLGTQNALYSQNMASAADVASAQASLASARVTLTQVDNGIAQLKSAIGVQLGWNAENPPEIGAVPAPDINFVLTTDKEADYQKAIENNSSYESIGEIKNYNGASAVYQRDAAVNEADAEYSSKFNSLYASMQEKKLLYDAAQTSLEIARISKEKAERLFGLGLCGKAEYEGMQLQYLSSEASASLASLALSQAINDYKWAINGLM